VPPPSPAPGTPQDWLARARGKLIMARGPLPPGTFLEDACFFCQQAAELAIKAVYQQRGWLFPFVHDLEQLLSGLQSQGLTVPADVLEAEKLTDFAVEARYPGLAPPVSDSEYEDAVQIAEAVVVWAQSLIP
jgi:HEPN domain-containing protein